MKKIKTLKLYEDEVKFYEKSLGRLAREQYLELNPHGYKSKTTKTKTKKGKSRAKFKKHRLLDF